MIFKYIHISFKEFTLEKFQSEITKNFKLNTTYSILLKISSGNSLIFKMCGPQMGIVIGNEHNLDYYSNLYNIILTRIETTIDNYDYLDVVEGLEIMYFAITTQKEMTLKNISNYNFNQQMINKKEVKKNFNQRLLPLTTDTSYYGFNVLLEERQKLIQLINSNIILSKNEKKFTINESDQIFIYASPNNKDKFIFVSKSFEDNQFFRYIFDYKTGIFINKIKDIVYSTNDNNKELFDRTIGNVTLTIEDQKIINYKVNNKLQGIKNYSKPISDRNINIGTFDLEVFEDSNGNSKVYAAGFCVDNTPYMFYLDSSNYDNVLIECINRMLVSKYDGYTFYIIKES